MRKHADPSPAGRRRHFHDAGAALPLAWGMVFLPFINDNRGMFTVRHYLTDDERDPFQDWMRKLRDPIAKGQVVKRVNRIEAGNFGDHKFCRDGVWELRIDQGPGYRVYYALAGTVLVLLLCGGDKDAQDADIQRAVEYWNDWQRRSA